MGPYDSFFFQQSLLYLSVLLCVEIGSAAASAGSLSCFFAVLISKILRDTGREGFAGVVMNDIYARRMAQSSMFQSIYKSFPVMWSATQITKEPLTGHLVQEELMRVNGHRAMPLLLPDVALCNVQNAHWNTLNDACAWAVSGRAFAVRNQTPLTQAAASIGRLEESIPAVRTITTTQIMTNVHLARCDGIARAVFDDFGPETSAPADGGSSETQVGDAPPTAT